MEDKESYKEKELLLKVAQGDKGAFSDLFHKHYHALGHYLYHVTKSSDLSQEIVQDVFMKIWMTREALENINNFKSYLFTISRNRAISSLRKIATERLRQQNYTREVMIEDISTLEQQQIKEYRLSLIDKAIEQLPPQQKKVYLLNRKDKFTYIEIASQLGITRETVKSHLQAATASITKFIKAHPDSPLWLIWLFFTKK